MRAGKLIEVSKRGGGGGTNVVPVRIETVSDRPAIILGTFLVYVFFVVSDVGS